MGRQLINCASQELVSVDPPGGLNCSSFMGPFTSFAGGYITNPAATVGCLYCPFRTTDQFMFTSFHVEYSHRWRNLGILMGVVVFNVRSFF
jgi:ATP-binding cassette subfamily G (WHITE) protein 2 (SNQ2)